MARLKITRIRSDIGRSPKQRATMRHLGLNKMYKSVTREDSSETRGMLECVAHLISVEEVE